MVSEILRHLTAALHLSLEIGDFLLADDIRRAIFTLTGEA